jgi:hypothetical protein
MGAMARRVAGVATAALLVVALTFGIWNGAVSVERRLRDASAYARLDPQARVNGGAIYLDVDRTFAAAAVAYVSRSGNWYLDEGDAADYSNPYVRHFMYTVLLGRLLPSRPVSPSQATWILCYGCDLDRWPEFTPVWRNGPYAIERRRS